MEDEFLENAIGADFDVQYGASNGLAEALYILSPAERELFQSLFTEGFTLAEYAGRFGITVAGVKKTEGADACEIERCITTGVMGCVGCIS